MNKKLKPCPFCGGNNLSVEGVTFYWVECVDCNASIAGYETKEQAIEAWNRRAKECSECGEVVDCKYKFCPNCGARMEE